MCDFLRSHGHRAELAVMRRDLEHDRAWGVPLHDDVSVVKVITCEDGNAVVNGHSEISTSHRRTVAEGTAVAANRARLPASGR